MNGRTRRDQIATGPSTPTTPTIASPADSPARRHAPADLDAARLAHFRARVLADALSEATAAYWERRARALEDAAPRPGDYTGRATPDQLAEAGRRCRAAAAACRARATLEGPGLPVPPIVVAALLEGAPA